MLSTQILILYCSVLSETINLIPFPLVENMYHSSLQLRHFNILLLSYLPSSTSSFWSINHHCLYYSSLPICLLPFVSSTTAGLASYIETIETAKVPIVKFDHKRTGISVDICVNNDRLAIYPTPLCFSGYHNHIVPSKRQSYLATLCPTYAPSSWHVPFSWHVPLSLSFWTMIWHDSGITTGKLIRHYVREYPPLRPLTMVLKVFLSQVDPYNNTTLDHTVTMYRSYVLMYIGLYPLNVSSTSLQM